VQCELCHDRDLRRARNPDHLAGGLIRDCERCHTPLGWSRAHFAHAFFPLSGGHGGLGCFDCHPAGSFFGLNSQCYSCHQNEYAGAPNHVSGGFPLTCEDCHNINDWGSVSFAHQAFPLTGAHLGLNCTACHVGGNFQNLPTDCYSCHQDDYNGAPDHLPLNFPLMCESCHNTTDWGNTNFVHTFPIQGPHNVPCIQCHTDGQTTTFNCLDCHDQTETDDDHDEVGGYVYQSQACFNCHPDGNN
jgi:hypothetical protein